MGKRRPADGRAQRNGASDCRRCPPALAAPVQGFRTNLGSGTRGGAHGRAEAPRAERPPRAVFERTLVLLRRTQQGSAGRDRRAEAPGSGREPGQRHGPSVNRMKRVLLFTGKLGYQTRGFEEAAQRLGVELVYVTDRCHQLEDPWNDGAIPVHFADAEAAAYLASEKAREGGASVDGVLALGDRPAQAA